MDENFECSRFAGSEDVVVVGKIMRIARGCKEEERRDGMKRERGKY